jgi:hypothetical protein
MSETILIKYGRYSCVIRPDLRKFLASQKNKNKYINDLIEKDYKAK